MDLNYFQDNEKRLISILNSFQIISFKVLLKHKNVTELGIALLSLDAFSLMKATKY